MGIRVIGVDKGVTGRLRESPDGNAVGEPTLSFKPVGEQYVIDEPNDDEQHGTNEPSEFIDPATIDTTGTNDSGSGTTGSGKRRGRKPGSRNKSGGNTSRTNTSKTTASVAAMLFTIHSVAASLTKIQALRIPKNGCEDLAQAILEVTELYEIPMLSEKSMAWTNLAAVACKVYIFNGKATVVKGEDNVTVISDTLQSRVQMPDWMKGAKVN